MRFSYRTVLAAIAFGLLATTTAVAQLLPAFGGDRAGTSGFQFLKVPVDPRGAAMGQTVVANAFDASALFWNPALAAEVDGPQVGISHTAYFADVKLNYASVVYPVRSFRFGVSVQSLDSGAMDVTTEFQPFGTGQTFRFTDLAVGLTVSQGLTDLFSYGVTARYVRESLAQLTADAVVFDFGVFYRVGTTGVQLGVVIRSFGFNAGLNGSIERTVIGGTGSVVETDFEAVTPPTTFMLGLAYQVLRGDPKNQLLVSAQLSNPNDNAESFNVGLEYTWNDVLMLRAGYRLGVEEYTTPSFGIGLVVPGLGPRLRFDYGFSQLDRLGTVHRAGLNLAL